MAVKLKPCPFCGSTLVDMDCDKLPFFVVCQHCSSSGPMHDSWNAAANAWNRRVPVSTRQDAASPRGRRIASERGAGSDPHSCRPNASDAFCKGLAANCKAHPDKGANQP